MATEARQPAGKQTEEAPEARVIGRIPGPNAKGDNARYAVRVPWKRQAANLSKAQMKVLPELGFDVIDDPAEYVI